MIKVGDKVRFLNDGGYFFFEDFEDCYGVVKKLPFGNETIWTSVNNQDGFTHRSFRDNPEGFNFKVGEYEKIEEV